jgi:hypothetical protein
MPIGIRFVDAQLTEEGNAIGEIRLNDFVEQFEAPLTFWTVEDYERQWARGLRRISEGSAKSCLITAMYDPTVANFIIWWPIYRELDHAVVQNQVLFMKKLKGTFDVQDPYRSIDERVSITEDGEPISEWIVSID